MWVRGSLLAAGLPATGSEESGCACCQVETLGQGFLSFVKQKEKKKEKKSKEPVTSGYLGAGWEQVTFRDKEEGNLYEINN